MFLEEEVVAAAVGLLGELVVGVKVELVAEIDVGGLGHGVGAVHHALELDEGGIDDRGAGSELHLHHLVVGGAEGDAGTVGALVLAHEQNLLADETRHELAVNAGGGGGGVHLMSGFGFGGSERRRGRVA